MTLDGHHRVICLAGGGTGGHITPGLAIGEAIATIAPSARVVMTCSTRPLDTDLLSNAPMPWFPIDATPFGVRPRSLARFLLAFRRGRRTAMSLLEQEAVTDVIALGGFAAAPVVSAAARRRLPITLCNFDQPPGRANVWMARHATTVASTVDTPRIGGVTPHRVPMPIRRAAVAQETPQACRTALGLSPARPTLLVTGASQGARTINELVVQLAREGDLDQWQVIHLAGTDHVSHVTRLWRDTQVPAAVFSYLPDIGMAWGAADLAISRAGANSVAEAHANAVPTIFLPYPWHRDHHQRHNAAPMVSIGGAVVETDQIDLGRNIAGAGATVKAMLHDSPRREAMRTALRAHPLGDGARAIAEIVLSGGPEDMKHTTCQ